MNMKNSLEKEICRYVHDFILEREDKIKVEFDTLGFEDREDFHYKLKTDIMDALWAMTELCFWGMDENYTTEHFLFDEDVEGEYDYVYHIFDSNGVERFFKLSIEKPHNVIYDSVKEVYPIETIIKKRIWTDNIEENKNRNDIKWISNVFL